MDLHSSRDSNPHLLAGRERRHREVASLGSDGGGGLVARRFDRCASSLPRARRPKSPSGASAEADSAGARMEVVAIWSPRRRAGFRRQSRRLPETIDRSPLSLRSFAGSTASFASLRCCSRTAATEVATAARAASPRAELRSRTVTFRVAHVEPGLALRLPPDSRFRRLESPKMGANSFRKNSSMNVSKNPKISFLNSSPNLSSDPRRKPALFAPRKVRELLRSNLQDFSRKIDASFHFPVAKRSAC